MRVGQRAALEEQQVGEVVLGSQQALGWQGSALRAARSVAAPAPRSPAAAPARPPAPTRERHAGAARSRLAGRPGPSGSGTSDAADLVERCREHVGGQRRARPAQRGSAQATRGDPARRPASPPPGPPHAAPAASTPRLAHEQRHQLVAAGGGAGPRPRPGPPHSPRPSRRTARRCRRRRLGEQAQDLGVELGLAPARAIAPPGHARPDPVGGLQRVERPALAQLAAAEPDVDLAAQPAARVGIADQGDELAQRLTHPGAHAAAEAALQRPRVLGHLAGDRREDLLGHRLELRLDQVGDSRGQARARALYRQKLSSES